MDVKEREVKRLCAPEVKASERLKPRWSFRWMMVVPVQVPEQRWRDSEGIFGISICSFEKTRVLRN